MEKPNYPHFKSNVPYKEIVVGVIGGNIGISFSKCVLKEIFCPNEKIVYLLELSSFQLEFISSFRPLMAIYTNISEDHLDRHNSMKNI